MTTNNIGRTPDNMVPRKLVKGMAVVVFIKPDTCMAWSEIDEGFIKGKWFKAKLGGFSSDGWVVIRINNNRDSLALQSHELIVVRSTSYADNDQAKDKANSAKCNANRKARMELAKVKPL